MVLITTILASSLTPALADEYYKVKGLPDTIVTSTNIAFGYGDKLNPSEANGTYRYEAGNYGHTNKNSYRITCLNRRRVRKPGYEKTWSHAREYYEIVHEDTNTVFYLVRRVWWDPPVPRHFNGKHWVAYRPGAWIRSGHAKWVQADGKPFASGECPRCSGKKKEWRWFTFGYKINCRDCNGRGINPKCRGSVTQYRYECSKCGGTGERKSIRRLWCWKSACPDCGGDGKDQILYETHRRRRLVTMERLFQEIKKLR